MPDVARPLPVIATAGAAYRDVVRALRAMPMLFAAGLLIVLAVGVAQDMIPRRIWDTSGLGTLLDFGASVIEGFCLTPVLIAVHRFIILDEATSGYAPDPSEPGYMRFFGWLVAVSAISALVFLLPDGLAMLGTSPFLTSALFFLALAAFLLAGMRLSILFPAIAVQAPGARLAEAIADTRGRFVRIVAAFLLVVVPCAAASVLITVILGRGVMRTGSSLAIFHTVVGSAIHIILLWLCAALASRIFQAIGVQLLRPVPRVASDQVLE